MQLKIIQPGTIDKCKDTYILLRAELIMYHHEKYNRQNYTITKENAMNKAKKELVWETNWGFGLKLSIEELLLMEIEDAYRLKKERTKVLMVAWLDKLSQGYWDYSKEDEHQN